MPESIEERVLRVISSSRRIPRAAVLPECTLDELGIDSLDRVNILFDLESEFNIDIDGEEAKKATKVSEIVEAMKQLVEESVKASPEH
jgi:acyl carrier protein